MTERQLRRLADRWAPRLGLDGWTIDITIGTSELGAGDSAMCRPAAYYRRARIQVAPDALERGQGAPTWEHLVVHELLHIATRDIRQAALEYLDGQVAPAAHEVYELAFERALEGEVDRLAGALVAAFAGRSV